MPLKFHDNRVPRHWLHGTSSPLAAPVAFAGAEPALKIGIVNNMPDSALEDTESQFFRLLSNAANDTLVQVELYSLPHLPRAERALQHLNSFYRDIDDLWNHRLDGLIVTGTEPRQPDLKDEPYWSALVEILDWAERNTSSTVLSCLAAHAGVLHADGIPRHPLNDKRFGIFAHARVAPNILTRGAADQIPVCHSRWNEVRADELTASGYIVLTESSQAGVDLFSKQKRRSLFLHFQGHPEYETETLLKEYRRDIKRYLRGERETYPSMPAGYFDAAATRALADFQNSLGPSRGEHHIAQFPERVSAGLQNTWSRSSAHIYRNWFQFLRSPSPAAASSRDTVPCRNV